MSTYNSGLDSILMELEAAIKNSYMAEFENFINTEDSNTTEQKRKENPLPSKILDSEDQEAILQALERIESENEMINMLKIEEQVYLNILEDREKVYGNLYTQSTKRIAFLVKIIRNLIKERNEYRERNTNYIVESNKDDLINSYKEKIRSLNSKILTLHSQFSACQVERDDLKELYEKLNIKFEDLKYELDVFKGVNDKVLKKLELETLFKIEEDLHSSLKTVAKIKSEKILDCMHDLKNSKQAVEDAKKCIICHENQACILLKPCNHANVCEHCSLQLTNCPIDRAIIVTQEKIFL